MSFFSSMYSKIFKKEPAPLVITSITDSEVYQVKLEDIKKLVNINMHGNFEVKPIHLQVLNQSINSQLKVLYSYHMLLLFNDQSVVQTVSQWIDNGELKPIHQELSLRQSTQTNTKQIQVHHNQTQTLSNDKMIFDQMQLENSMYFKVEIQKQESKSAHICELEQALVDFYYNYLQRLSWGIDVLQSSKIRQYPYPPEYFIDTKQKFLWLYKIINLLNYQTSGIQLIKYNFQHISINTPIIKDVASQILNDCIIEYGFLQSEVADMIDTISSMHVSDAALQFYEVYQILLDQTKVLQDFHGQKDRFQPKLSNQYDVQWFKMTKEQKSEVEDYIFKIKFLHTCSFRKSLNVPTKNVALEALRSQLIQYQTDPKALRMKNKKTNKDFVSTRNNNEIKFRFNNETLISNRYSKNMKYFDANQNNKLDSSNLIQEETKDDIKKSLESLTQIDLDEKHNEQADEQTMPIDQNQQDEEIIQTISKPEGEQEIQQEANCVQNQQD